MSFFSFETPTGSLLRRTFEEFTADNCFRMAAALAYHTAFSLAPLLVLVMTILGAVIDPQVVQGETTEALSQVVGSDTAQTVLSMVTQMQKGASNLMAALLSVVALVFGAANLMAELQAALNDIWKVEPHPERDTVTTFVVRRLACYAMILTVAIVLLASLVSHYVIDLALLASAGWMSSELHAALTVLADLILRIILYAVVFAALFKFVPETKVDWRDAAAGGVVTALAFLAGREAIGWYLGQAQLGSVYGAGGSLVALLLWVYYSTLILLLGAEFTHVWGLQRQGVEPVPSVAPQATATPSAKETAPPPAESANSAPQASLPTTQTAQASALAEESESRE